MEVELAELALPPTRKPRDSSSNKPLGAGARRDAATRRDARHRRQGDGRSGKGRPAGADDGTEHRQKIGFVLSTTDNTLDLRGQRLEVALEKTEAFCDLGVVKHVSPLVLIHGHGTGKLKAGIRGWLTGNRYVDGFRPGEAGEGGDGVTVVALNL